MGEPISIFNKIDKETLQALVDQLDSMESIMKRLRLSTSGLNYQNFKKRCRAEKIDISKFKTSKEFPLSQILVENSTYGNKELKKRLIKNGLIENKCAECGSFPIWLTKELVLVLDHINGINNDNRLTNLRLLCPNCNSQTPTFAGRNRKSKQEFACARCGKKIKIRKHYKKLCNECKIKLKSEVTPSKKDLQPFVYDLQAAANKFNVTTRTIRRWLHKHNLYDPDGKYRPGKVDEKKACEIRRLYKIGLTQAEIGNRLKLSQTTIGRIINSDVNLTLGGEVVVKLTISHDVVHTAEQGKST